MRRSLGTPVLISLAAVAFFTGAVLGAVQPDVSTPLSEPRQDDERPAVDAAPAGPASVTPAQTQPSRDAVPQTPPLNAPPARVKTMIG